MFKNYIDITENQRKLIKKMENANEIENFFLSKVYEKGLVKKIYKYANLNKNYLDKRSNLLFHYGSEVYNINKLKNMEKKELKNIIKELSLTTDRFRLMRYSNTNKEVLIWLINYNYKIPENKIKTLYDFLLKDIPYSDLKSKNTVIVEDYDLHRNPYLRNYILKNYIKNNYYKR